MTELVARQCWISGHVQGVFFRGSTREKAVKWGISGYAKNLPDGRVEVLIVGESTSADRLVEWLKQGPPAARVTNVEVRALELDALGAVPVGFATR